MYIQPSPSYPVFRSSYSHFLCFRPFEAMSDYVREEIKARATPAMKRILALDHPYPVLKM